MNETDTPRTDKAAATIREWIFDAPAGETRGLAEPVPSDFARQLERYLTAANARADLWRKRCKEAQSWLKVIECADDSSVAAARDAGKDE